MTRRVIARWARAEQAERHAARCRVHRPWRSYHVRAIPDPFIGPYQVIEVRP